MPPQKYITQEKKLEPQSHSGEKGPQGVSGRTSCPSRVSAEVQPSCSVLGPLKSCKLPGLPGPGDTTPTPPGPLFLPVQVWCPLSSRPSLSTECPSTTCPVPALAAQDAAGSSLIPRGAPQPALRPRDTFLQQPNPTCCPWRSELSGLSWLLP